MKNSTFGLALISLLLSVLIGTALSRHGWDGATSSRTSENKAAKDTLLIGLSMDTLKEARWKRDRDLFVARAEALGARVEVLSANSDDGAQLRNVQSLITNGVDVLVIIPHDGAAMGRAVEEAHKAGIPVIAYDRLITGCELDLYVTFDNVRVGRAQARYLLDHLPTPGQGRIVRIYGAPTDNNARLFKQGQDEALAAGLQAGKIEVLHENWAVDWQPDKAKDIMNAAITNHGSDFVAVLASNDGTAGGAIQSLREAGLAGKVLVTGQDAELAACQRIVEGTQTMTIYKPLKNLAETAATLAVDLAAGRPVIARDAIDNGTREVPSVLLPVVAVDKANMLEVVVGDGFHAYEDVYRNVPESERPAKP